MASASLNKVQLIGNIGQTPDVKYTKSGTPLCSFSLATSESYKQKDGEQREATEWHKLVIWGPRAESLGPHLSKGKQVYVEGSLQTRSYDKDGQKHYTTEIRVDKLQFLGKSVDLADAPVGQPVTTPYDKPQVAEDDIPF